MIGKTISHYFVLEELGRGGMGVVYKARDTKLDRIVALKFLPPHLAVDEVQKSRFIQEAKAASAIDHPNIAAIFEIGEEDGQLFIAMAYYEGETLKNKIEHGPMLINRALDYMLQIVRGLAKAHESGIVHRDLKPANVLVTPENVAKIIDFGLAKLVGGAQLTRTGTSMGTVAYMSPEQVRGEDLDARTDIWSLGVLTYEMLTGTLPFRGEFETAMMYSVLNENPPSVTTLRSDLPLEFVTIIEKAMTKEREERYQTMEDLEAALTILGKNLEAGLTTDTTGQLVKRAFRSVVSKRSRVLLASGVIATAIAAFVIWNAVFDHRSVPANSTLALLPFVNLGDPLNAYFPDGLNRELYAELGKLRELKVISQSSTSSFGGYVPSDDSIARELGVRFLLKGAAGLAPAQAQARVWLYDVERHRNVLEQQYEIPRDALPDLREMILRDVLRYAGFDAAGHERRSYMPAPDVYDWYLRGTYYREKETKEDNKLAIDYLSEAVSRDSGYVSAILNLASCQVERYKQGWARTDELLAEAERHCRKAMSLDSTRVEAYAILGNIADCRGNRDAALQLLQKAVAKDPHNLYAVSSIVLLYLTELNAPGKAVVYLEKLHELDPTDWITACNLGVGYAQTKNYPKAKEVFRRAMVLNPAHEWPLYSLGYTCERIGEIDSSISYYRKAIFKNPKYIQSYAALASVLLATGKFAVAESLIGGGLHDLEGEHEFLYLLGVVHRLSGKRAEAARIFRDGLKLVQEKIAMNPGVADDVAFAGLFQARLGNVAYAISLAAGAARLDSSDEEVIMKITRMYGVLGMKEQMLGWFRRAKQMNPEYDAAYVATAMDFEKFRNDPDLLALARQEY